MRKAFTLEKRRKLIFNISQNDELTLFRLKNHLKSNDSFDNRLESLSELIKLKNKLGLP